MNQRFVEPVVLAEQQAEPASLPVGFTMRPPVMADLEAAMALFNDCSAVMTGRPEARLEDIEREWLSPHLKMEESFRVVCSPEGRLVGYVEVWDLDDPPVSIWIWGRVHPDFEGLGIGTYLMAWAEQRARRAIERAPADARVVIHAATVSSYEPARRLFRSLDMALVRHHWHMRIELDQEPPAPQWSGGLNGQPLTIRTFADFGDARAVFRAIHDAFADHWGYVQHEEEAAFEHWSHFAFEDHGYDPALWFLALDGDEIAGLSLCRPDMAEDPDMGWVGTLGVRRPWRRRGLGLALLQHSFGEFYRRGQKRVGLGVDAASLTGATKLYEKAGMTVARQFEQYEKELRPGRELRRQEL